MPKSAAVYATTDEVFRIVADDVTDVGVLIASDHVHALDGPSDDELGRTVLRAIDEGRLVRHPDDQAAIRAATAAFVRAMGFRSHRQLMQACRLAVVQLNGRVVVAIPTDNEGPRDGYRHRLDEAVSVEADDPDEIGAAVRAAVAASTRANT
jgi:hypothetical protein